MLTHDASPRLLRPLLLLLGTVWFVLGALVAPAVADRPEGWEPAPHVSVLQYFVLIVLIPLGAAAVITLLVLLPSLASRKGYEPGQSWRGDTEWFGGPAKGVKGADEVTPEQIEQSSTGAGGVSGRW